MPYSSPYSSQKGRFVKGWRRANTSGAAALEFAVVLPVLLLLTFGFIDIARLTWTYTTLQRAATAAARWGAVNTSYALNCTSAPCPSAPSTADIQQKAVAEAWSINVQTSAFTVSTQTCGLRVSVNVTYSFLIPWIGPDTQLTPNACYPI
jgi:Flp pilus assembly protein TadG